MLGLGLWKLEDDGMLSLEDGDLRLLVQQKSGSALFLVRQHCMERPAHPLALVASGVRDSVREAMADAEKAAARLAAARRQGEHVAHGARASRPHAP